MLFFHILATFFSGMWTARNIFIATLAVADSSLCLFAMPMTLVGILTKYWPFGPQTWLLCKLARSMPAATIFFSSYTMMVIAIDRQRFIVYSTKRQVRDKTFCHIWRWIIPLPNYLDWNFWGVSFFKQKYIVWTFKSILVL